MNSHRSQPDTSALPETPEDDALPLDEVGEEANQPTVPPVVTALDDDEDGATPLDPETGLPYEEIDSGAATVPAERSGGASES